MDKKPRYSVMLDGDRTVYSGNSRFVALDVLADEPPS